MIRRPSPLPSLLLASVLLCAAPCARAGTASTAPPDSAIAFPSPADRRWQLGPARADRLQHGSLSAVLAATLRLSGRSRAEAFGLTLALGVLKELRDARHAHFDAGDLAADAAGAALGARTSPSGD